MTEPAPHAPAAAPLRGARLLVAGAGLACGWYVVDRVVFRAFEGRIAFEESILAGTAEPPYRFRVLWPALGRIADRAVGLGIRSPHWQHCLGYGALTLLVFAAVFLLFHDLLRRMFTPTTALVGTLLLAVVVPLSVTGFWVEDDFVTLLVFVAGFQLMARGRDAWVPLLVAVGTLNREQTVYLAVFHLIFAATREERRLGPAIASFAAFGTVYAALHAAIGEAPSRFPVARHLDENSQAYHLLRTTLPLWLAQFGAAAALAVAAFREADRFFRWALLALVPYVALFAMHGDLWETAKFLPAMLVLLPMAMQTLTGERARIGT